MAENPNENELGVGLEIKNRLLNELAVVMVAQKPLLERLFLGVLLQGHILIEGVPGLAKTTAVKAMSHALDLDFQRIQFTPDMLPADLLGTQMYNQKTGDFFVRKGPLFHSMILADEINRAPAKVQSALLEAMQERQITLGEETFLLPDPFIVLATQNPIEQEGTYPLPEAELDRFLFKLKLDYPSLQDEKMIVTKMSKSNPERPKKILRAEQIVALRRVIESLHVDEKITDYIVRLVQKTRQHALLRHGASPRASMALFQSAKAFAFLQGRDFVLPSDVKNLAPDVLRHRLVVSYEAVAMGKSADDVILEILNQTDILA